MKYTYTFLLLLLIGAVLVQETEAGWLKKLVKKVKDFIKKCNVGVQFPLSVSVSCRKRRAANPNSIGLSDAGFCGSLGIPLTAQLMPKGAVEEAFNQADDDEDDKLTPSEYIVFLEIIEILEGCFQLNVNQPSTTPSQ